MSVDIPPHFLPFVQKAIASGRYESEGAMIGERLKLLALRERELELVQKGFDDIERGDYIELDDEGLAKFSRTSSERDANDCEHRVGPMYEMISTVARSIIRRP